MRETRTNSKFLIALSMLLTFGSFMFGAYFYFISKEPEPAVLMVMSGLAFAIITYKGLFEGR